MPRLSPDDFDAFLEQPHIGVIATLRRDGAPYTVPVWWLWEPASDGARDARGYRRGIIWLTGTTTRVWCRQLKRDGRASLCIESGPPFTAHVEFDGVCEARELPGFDIWPISRRLAEKYVGATGPASPEVLEKFWTNMQTEPRLLFRMEPRVVRAIDMRVYRGKRADREFQAQQRANPT